MLSDMIVEAAVRPPPSDGTTDRDAKAEESHELLQARMKINELQDQLEEVRGQVADEASRERVELDRYVRDLTGEIAGLLQDNMSLQHQLSSQASTGAAADSGEGEALLRDELAALKKTLQGLRAQLDEQQQRSSRAEDAVQELRAAEEQWMVAVREAEERALMHEQRAAEQEAALAECKLAEEGFLAGIQDLQEQLMRYQAQEQQGESVGNSREATPEPSGRNLPQPQAPAVPPSPPFSPAGVISMDSALPPCVVASCGEQEENAAVSERATDSGRIRALEVTLARKEVEEALLREAAQLTQEKALRASATAEAMPMTPQADDAMAKQLVAARERINELDAEVRQLKEGGRMLEAAAAVETRKLHAATAEVAALREGWAASAAEVVGLQEKVAALQEEVQRLNAADGMEAAGAEVDTAKKDDVKARLFEQVRVVGRSLCVGL